MISTLTTRNTGTLKETVDFLINNCPSNANSKRY